MFHKFVLVVSSLIIAPLLGGLFIKWQCIDFSCGYESFGVIFLGVMISLATFLVLSKVVVRIVPKNLALKTERILILVILVVIVTSIFIVEPIREVILEAINLFLSPDVIMREVFG